jgi:CHAT domain-containing protein
VLHEYQGRYADVESLYPLSLPIQEKALGPAHHHVGAILNNLALLYQAQGRFGDALPLAKRMMVANTVKKTIAFPIFYESQTATPPLISANEAFTDSYQVLQRAFTSSAGEAVSKLAARFAADTDELAQFVRKDQDLMVESERLDKLIITAVSKPPAERNATAEGEIRTRMKEIKLEGDKLQEILTQRFPDYVALTKPQPLTLQQTQALLADDEALVLFDFDAKSYAWVITRSNAGWTELKLAAKDLTALVKQLRQSLTFDIDKPFDVKLAFKIYLETFGAVADKLQGKARLSVVTNGALTSLPLQLLVTKEPSSKPLKNVDWLVRSYAITNLPSVASLKTLRSTASNSSAVKPMIAFADPIFSKEEKAQVAALRSVINFYEGGKPDLVSLAKFLPQLPDTEKEIRAIADVLNADKNDLKLGVFASETTVKQTKLDAYRIVYFATHGLVAGEVEKFAKVKAEPALALTIPDKPTKLDDGLLTASEVAQLKLNADWVVLSACNTAAEGSPGAEALSGLARAFFYAGARSLVVSHWEVDSEPLMTGTFQEIALDPKLSHAEALRNSILSMIDSAQSDDDAHPRIWAPFVVVGEPAKRQ